VAEGLRRIIQEATIQGLLKGLNITKLDFITHLIFVDNIMIFGAGNIKQFHVIKDIMYLLWSTIGI